MSRSQEQQALNLRGNRGRERGVPVTRVMRSNDPLVMTQSRPQRPSEGETHRTLTHTHAHTLTLTLTLTLTHTHSHSLTLTHSHTHTHTHTHTLTHTLTQTHTDTHTHIQAHARILPAPDLHISGFLGG